MLLMQVSFQSPEECVADNPCVFKSLLKKELSERWQMEQFVFQCLYKLRHNKSYLGILKQRKFFDCEYSDVDVSKLAIE
jgi:hypothetical protein